jgi:hypothetical protein
VTRRQGRHALAIAAALLGTLIGAAPAAADGGTTQITSPANETFFQFKNLDYSSVPVGFASPLSTSVTVSGTASSSLNGEIVDIVCSFGPGTGQDNATGPADEVLGSTMVTSGAFSTSVSLLATALDTCTLQAVPTGDYDPTSGISNPSDFTGPTIGVDYVDDGESENSGLGTPLTSDFLFTATQLDGYMEWTSASACGLSLSYPYDATFDFEGDTSIATEPLFNCAGALYPEDNDTADSEIMIDGYPAYTAYGLWELISSSYFSGPGGQAPTPGYPSDTVTQTLDPSTGDVTITEVEPLSFCSLTSPTYTPQDFLDDCPYVVNSDITLTRTITQSANGLQAEVTDSFTDSSGSARALVAVYDDHIGSQPQYSLEGPTGALPDSSATSPAFSFDGGAYTTRTPTLDGSASDDLITSFPAAPASIGIQGEAGLGSAGGIADPQGAITYTTAPSQAQFFTNNWYDGVSDGFPAAEFELTYDRTIPASGSTTITQFYTQSLGRTSADALAAQAADSVASPSVAFSSPAAGATVSTPTITVSGTASGPAGTPTLTLNGASVPVAGGSWSTQVTLQPGQNTLTAVATNADGHQAQAHENVIYSPPGTCVVPALSGLSQSAAQAALTTAGCTVGTVVKALSASVPSGDVITANPSAGTEEGADYPVELVVSLGPASNHVSLDSVASGKDGDFIITIGVPDDGELHLLVTAGAGGLAGIASALHPGSGRFVYAQKFLSANLGRVKVTLVPTKRGRRLLSLASASHPIHLRLYIGFAPLSGHAIPKPRAHLIRLY